MRSRLAGVRILRLLGTGESDYLGLVSRSDPEQAWYALGRDLAADRTWDLLHLNSVPDLDVLQPALERELGPIRSQRVYEVCPRIPVDCTWDSFLAARNKDFRKNLKRWTRRVEELGEVTVRVDRPPLGAAVLPELEEVERASWKWESGDATFRSPSKRSFLSGLLGDARMDMSLWRMTVAGRLSAFAVVLNGVDAWYYYLATFREIDGHAGSYLLMRIIERACETPECRFVDLLRGAFGYKLAWATETRPVYEVVLGRNLAGRTLETAYRMRWRAAQSDRLRKLRAHVLRIGDRREG